MLTPSLWIAISLAHADWTDAAPLSATPAQLLDAARASEPAKDFNVDVLVDEEKYTIDDEGRVTVETWLVYKIVDQAAIDGWGSVTASWAPWHQDRAEIRARVIDPDGREWTLDPKTLVEATGAGNTSYSFDDDHTLRGPLPGIRVGSIVEEVHVVHENRPFVGRFGSGSTRIDRGGLDNALRVVRVEAPAGVQLKWALEGLDDGKVKVQERHVRGATVVEVTAKEYAKLEDWQTKVGLNELQGRYLEFSTAPSWSAIVSAYAEQIEPLIDPTGLDDILTAARAGKDDDDKIRLAVRAVQSRMRYAAIPFGEHAIVPYAPALALSRAYGDCKDQAVAVTAALRELGFDAHVALLWSGGTLDLPATIPRLDRFNHAIVVVKRASGELWIDPTVRGTPVGELPYGDEHHLAVIVDKSTTAPVVTPRGTATFRQTIDVDLSRAGPAPIRAEMSGTSWAIGGYRESLADADKAAREEWAEGAFGVDDDDKHEVKSTFQAVEEDDKDFAFTVEYKRPNSAYVGLTDSIARAGPSGLLADLAIPADDLLEAIKAVSPSVATMRLSPERSEVVWHLQLPPGMSWDAAPVDDVLEVGPIHLSRTLTHDDHNLWTLVYRLDITADGMPLPQAAELAEALKLGTYNTTLTLTAHSDFAREISDGHTFDAAKMASDLVQANPDSPLARAQLVVALEDMGLGDAATAQAAVLTRRWPDSVETARADLSAASRDERGRYQEGSWDRARARAALEHLGTVEPDATSLAMLRIDMLLVPPDTLTPPPAADIALASTLLDALIKDTGETADTKSLKINLRYLSGELSALAALPYDAAWGSEAAGDWMAAVLLKRGASAIGLTRQAIQSSVRAAATKRATQDLVRARHPELSLALLCFDLPGEFAKVFASRKDVKPWDTIVEENGPLAPYVGWAAVKLEAPGVKPAWTRFEAPSVALDESDTHSSQSQMRTDPLTVTTILDSLAMMYEQPVTDHDIARAALHDPSSGQQSSEYAQVDGARVRVLGGWSTAGAVALKALERLDHKDADGALRLLTWISEDVDGSSLNGETALAAAFHTVWPAPAEMDKQAAMRRALTVASLFAPGGWSTLLSTAKATPAEWPASTLGALAQTECSAERWPAAVALARHAMSVGNTDRTLTFCLMRALRETHDFEGAITAGRAWLTTHPDDHSVLSSVASSLYALNRDDEALEAAHVASVDRVSANSAAWLMLLAGENDAALKAITPVGTENNASSAVRHTYAIALIASGRLADAQKEWERARGYDGMGSEWWYVAGGLAEGLGLREQAITAYRRVERSDERDATWQFSARALTRLGEKP